jgi:hypothetical protein
MRLLHDLGRLGERKRFQAEQALAAANEHAATANAKQNEAQDLRLAAARLLDEAVVIHEHGMTRDQLFNRLRTLAVSRAHVLESNHRADVLDTEAAQSFKLEAELKRQSSEYRRKGQKIAEWKRRQTRELALKAHRRAEQETQEEYACRQ